LGKIGKSFFVKILNCANLGNIFHKKADTFLCVMDYVEIAPVGTL
jgi:hypothetical protein